MSTDGKIYITISDAREGEVIKGTKEMAPKKSSKKNYDTAYGEGESFEDFSRHLFFNFIESEAKQMAQYTLGNIGNFTGDYNAQRQVNHIMSIASTLVNIGVGAKMGAAWGPYGAIIGAGIAATTQAINFGLQLRSQNLEITKQNYSINQLKQLSGLDGLTNGGRI